MSESTDALRELAEASDAYRAARDRVQAALRAVYPIGAPIEWMWFGERRTATVIGHEFGDLIRADRGKGDTRLVDAFSIVEAWRAK